MPRELSYKPNKLAQGNDNYIFLKIIFKCGFLMKNVIQSSITFFIERALGFFT